MKPLPADANDQIFAKVARDHQELQELNFGKVCASTIICTRDNQKYAVIGRYAYELMHIDNPVVLRPAIANGQAFRIFPHEGHCGTLHWILIRNNWRLSWFSASGWIYAEELTQSNQQILHNITSEIEAGQTPLTGLNDKEN